MDQKNNVKYLGVTNDTSERGVKQIHKYDKLLTKTKEQQQIMLDLMNEYRQTYSNCNKKTIVFVH